jgi:hypothetical protein
MKALRDRYNDWRHERRINALHRKVRAHILDHDFAKAREVNLALTKAITSRSPQQVARMEKARGLR